MRVVRNSQCLPSNDSGSDRDRNHQEEEEEDQELRTGMVVRGRGKHLLLLVRMVREGDLHLHLRQLRLGVREVQHLLLEKLGGDGDHDEHIPRVREREVARQERTEEFIK